MSLPLVVETTHRYYTNVSGCLLCGIPLDATTTYVIGHSTPKLRYTAHYGTLCPILYSFGDTRRGPGLLMNRALKGSLPASR